MNGKAGGGHRYRELFSNYFKIVLAFGWIIPYIKSSQADMAQLVEHNLAKVGVAGSSPVVRSIAFPDRLKRSFFGEVAKW